MTLGLVPGWGEKGEWKCRAAAVRSWKWAGQKAQAKGVYPRCSRR